MLCCSFTQKSAITVETVLEGSSNYGFHVEKGKMVTPSHIHIYIHTYHYPIPLYPPPPIKNSSD